MPLPVMILSLLLIYSGAYADDRLTLRSAGEQKIELARWLSVSNNQATNLNDLLSQKVTNWQPWQIYQTLPLTKSSYWFKLEIYNPLKPNNRVIQISGLSSGNVRLFHLVDDKIIEQQINAQFTQASINSTKHSTLLYPLLFAAKDTHQIYLHVTDVNPALLNFHLFSAEGLTQPLYHGFSSGIILGALISLGLFALIIAGLSRSPSHAYYAGYIFCLVIFLGSIFNPNLSTKWPIIGIHMGDLQPMLVALLMVFNLLFIHQVLRLERFKSPAIRSFPILIICGVCLSFVLMLITNNAAIAISLSFALICSALLVLLTIKLSYHRQKLAKLYLPGCVLLMGSSMFACLTFMPDFHYKISYLSFLQWGLIGHVVFMTFVMAYRHKQAQVYRKNIRFRAQKRIRRIQQIRKQALKAEIANTKILEHKVKKRTRALQLALKELNEANKQLLQKASFDGLTKVKNREAFEDKLLVEGRISCRQQTPISLLMLDIDKFKAINDQYGHPAGDDILRKVAEILQNQLKRPNDLLSRYGGEEFAVILPNTSTDGAIHIAEIMRKAIINADINWQNNKIPLSISIGVSTSTIQTIGQTKILLEQADYALYQAKRQGRNQVQVFTSNTYNIASTCT